jgi:hypothetical protein
MLPHTFIVAPARWLMASWTSISRATCHVTRPTTSFPFSPPPRVTELADLFHSAVGRFDSA